MFISLGVLIVAIIVFILLILATAGLCFRLGFKHRLSRYAREYNMSRFSNQTIGISIDNTYLINPLKDMCELFKYRLNINFTIAYIFNFSVLNKNLLEGYFKQENANYYIQVAISEDLPISNLRLFCSKPRIRFYNNEGIQIGYEITRCNLGKKEEFVELLLKLLQKAIHRWEENHLLQGSFHRGVNNPPESSTVSPTDIKETQLSSSIEQ